MLENLFKFEIEPVISNNLAPLIKTNSVETVDSAKVKYNSNTLHGTHYTISDFTKEVETIVAKWIEVEKKHGDQLTDASIKRMYAQTEVTIYQKLNNCDQEQLIKFQIKNSNKFLNIESLETAENLN